MADRAAGDRPPTGDGVPLRDAATVMLVRDAPDGGGLEVAMLRRNLNSDFVGGAYVFPGGAVDPDDCHTNLEAVCVGRSDADASERLGIERGGLAFWVAAIRECFEEAGVLLARRADGDVITFTDPEVDARFIEHRRAVDSGERRLVEVCAEEGLRLAVDGMHYFSHWITPEGPPRRYDTRFFVAAAPPEQYPLHDDRETIANLWVRPQDALDAAKRGEFEALAKKREEERDAAKGEATSLKAENDQLRAAVDSILTAEWKALPAEVRDAYSGADDDPLAKLAWLPKGKKLAEKLTGSNSGGNRPGPKPGGDGAPEITSLVSGRQLLG